MAPPQRELVLLAVALVLAMSTWFSTAAVLGQLRVAWSLTDDQASWLTITVQLGFVAGALITAATNLADRIAPLRLFFIGTTGAAVANLVVVFAGGFDVAVAARFVTGAFLAAVYPPALKAMSGWFITGRGVALGVMIGALTIGSALPHLVNALGGFDWQATLAVASVLTVSGGLIAERICIPAPDTPPSAPFDPSQLRAILGNRAFRLASVGYFGHMWELYAMWAWIAAFYGDVFATSGSASLAAFCVIAAGAGGSVVAGLVSDRRSRAVAAGQALRWSALVCAGSDDHRVSHRCSGTDRRGHRPGVGLLGRGRQRPVQRHRDRVGRPPLRRHRVDGATRGRLHADGVHHLPGADRARRPRLGLGVRPLGTRSLGRGMGDAPTRIATSRGRVIGSG